ncbi:MAG: right-handed parallel beta-helix repeat-containing protein, partial [Flavobacteriales bacterium]|nr:right-handed parallel beta-helix repeat-containing protein [Flavobacteriales bacterium]
MNPTSGGSGIAIQDGNAKDMLISDNTINNAADGVYLRAVGNFTIEDNTISGVSDASATGIFVYGGSGDVLDNTLLDADGGLYLLEMEAPPSPTTALCEIGANEYSRSTSCTWTLDAGKEAAFNLQTDSWGYEIAITVTLPNGSTDSWPTYSFGSNTAYNPLTTYTAAGTYSLTVTDSWGDGGATIDILESVSGSSGYAGPSISGNTIGVSPGRTAPNAQGLVMIDCDGVNIQTSMNNVTLTDNAMLIESCDVADTGSIFVGSSASSTNGILADDTNSALTLNGTDISGYATGVMKEGGVLNMVGDADITGMDYGVYADDTEVIAIGASVDGGEGTGLHVVNSDNVWVYPMDASGDVGMYIENTPFRWDGGDSDAITALSVVDAIGSVENLTWESSTTQIDAGSGAHVTSIGNTLNASRINVHTTAVIDEANLLSLESTHLGVAPTNEVALLLTSTDNERASYVSTSFQPEVMTVDGSNDDWVGGNALNPSGYAMPGNMSGDGTDDFLVTYIEGDGVYFGMTGSDLSTSDVLIYLSVDGGGSDVGYNGLGGAHNLPFNANYVLWADSDASYDLYSYGFLGWGPSSLSTANVDVDFSTSVAELYVPWSRLGGTPDQIDIVAIVQAETTADIDVIHPMQTLDTSSTQQNLTKFMTVELTKDDLATGELDNEVLVYRSYKGSTTPSDAKEYDLMVKTSADCAQDWAIVEDISIARNVVFETGYSAAIGENVTIEPTIAILRACPVIDIMGTDPAMDGLVDYTVDEDSNAYTFTLTNLADDVQDEEADLTWTMTEGTLVAHDGVLVDWAQNGQSVTITPLENQFGTVVFAYEVTDSNGLTDDHNITFTVANINDA